jgi:hypothetical protein
MKATTADNTFTGKGGLGAKQATAPCAEPVCGVRNLT